MDSKPRPRRFAVIGAGGPAGLAAMKVVSEELRTYLLDGGYDLVGFEQREDVGGFWPPDTGQVSSSGFPFSPMYDSMVTNLPYPIMCYDSYRVPKLSPLFSNFRVVNEYLKDYAQHFNLKHLILFNSTVTAATWDQSTHQWGVIYLRDGKLETSHFDHLLVSNGRYRHIPEFPGFDTWSSQESRSYIHSSEYRNSEPYRERHVLVIGDGPSAWDISEEIALVTRCIIRSIRSLATESESTSSINLRGAISRFSSDGFVHFQSGLKEYVDRVIFTTGYQYDCSFLTQVPKHDPDFSSDHLYSSSFHIYPLALHMFPLRAAFPPKSLAFIGVPKGLVMFTLAEAQATLAIRLMTGKVSLDFDHELSETRKRTEKLKAECNDSAVLVAQKWHKIIPYQPHTYDLIDLTWERASDSRRVPDWQKELNLHAMAMRTEWRELERLGVADSSLEGIRNGDVQGWVDFMGRLVKKD